jgi:hypothetical protein
MDRNDYRLCLIVGHPVYFHVVGSHGMQHARDGRILFAYINSNISTDAATEPFSEIHAAPRAVPGTGVTEIVCHFYPLLIITLYPEYAG